MLPIHLVRFWYVESSIVLIRTWRNLLFFIEEDLAVGLMWRLIFVPLFHDPSFVGRILSLLFRVTRILIGLAAFGVATIFITAVAVVWFVTPFFFVGSFFLPHYLPTPLGEYIWWIKNGSSGITIFGLALFINHLLHHPLKKTWQVKKSQDLWQTTKLSSKDIAWSQIIEHREVKKILSLLEMQPINLSEKAEIEHDKLLGEAVMTAKEINSPHISAGHFFIAYLKLVPEAHRELLKRGVTVADFNHSLHYLEQTQQSWRKVFIWDEDFHIKHLKGINRGWLSAPTPSLDSVALDLTRQASINYVEDFIGRTDTVNQVIRALSQNDNRNVLLVGEAGVGKSTMVEYLAKMIVLGDAPESIATKRLVKLDASRLLSSVSTEGEMAQRIKSAFEEIQSIGDVIVFIDEIHELGVGDASKNYNIYALLRPYLESNSFQFLATTEPGNYARILEKEASLSRLFHKIEVEEASVDETLHILKIRAIDLQMQRGIITTFPALKLITQKAKLLIHDRKLPDSALYIFNECKSQASNQQITSDIAKVVLSRTIHMPLVELDQSQKQMLLSLEDIIHQRMIDQIQAVKAVSDTLRRAATDLREQNRPIGSFLFVGPTGVGKTELAKILSEVYFKQNDFLRYDMSEYQSSESATRLIGNSDNPGELTEAIKNKPYCLILLDEFEKADPKILTLFLQVLEDGRLTGGDGVTIDFTNTIIIATSNAGSLTIAQGLEQQKPMDLINNDVRDELLKIMKPELVNRFDNIVIFKPLSQFDLEEIVKIKLKGMQQDLLEKGYAVDFSKELTSELARRGYDPAMGARPLRRLIQDTLESNMSKLILEDKLKKGELYTANTDLLN